MRISKVAFTAEPSARSHPNGSTLKSPTDASVRWGSPRLRTKSSSTQSATVLQCIYEEDFVGFSYGFRPRRSQHQALDALYVGITEKRVNWILDADIEGFFDNIDRDWLVKFIEHRVGDRRIVR